MRKNKWIRSFITTLLSVCFLALLITMEKQVDAKSTNKVKIVVSGEKDLVINKVTSVNLYLEGGDGSEYMEYSIKDSEIVECAWGKWGVRDYIDLKLIPKKNGSTVVTIKDSSNNTVDLNITVEEIQEDIGYIGEVLVSEKSITMKDATFIETWFNLDNSDPTLYYSIQDPEIVSCSWGSYEDYYSILKIIPLKNGLTTITISNDENTSIAKVKVIVQGLSERPKLLSTTKTKLTITKKTQIPITFLGNFMADDATIYYQISDERILTAEWAKDEDYEVSYLTLKPKKKGTATITIGNTVNNEKIKIKVTVKGKIKK